MVIRQTAPEGHRYFLARRTEDSYWEFIGGKRKQHESIREAALRELDEELQSIEPTDADITEVAKPYPSAVAEAFSLYPVLIEFEREAATAIDSTSLSAEHNTAAWISLGEFKEFETLGQQQALSNLDLVRRGCSRSNQDTCSQT
ncbi:NUDIX domain-containing protein [Halomarina rubra]|uniref:NUDIX domain-containing protein n=1 Tax=Halomarina rubra TaxID=2071873 RepID=A0ABD6AU73_9EURY|nr:NUDIX domain-containing protein [Halomarina rubra]